MKTLSTYLISAAPLLAIASQTLAHPGHDHGHWASPMVHAPVLIAISSAAGSVYLLSRRGKPTTNEIKQEKS